MKRKTVTSRDYQERVNETLFCIHSDIHENHSVEALSSRVALSPFHFNRVFKEIVGESIHAYIKRVKLEHAANALLFNPQATITQILQEVGFSSNASFTQAFKELFGVTPTKWREIDQANTRHDFTFSPESLHVKLMTQPSRYVAYVRHKGYDKSIKMAWHKLQAWANAHHIDFTQQRMIGLHHSNPRFVEASQCHYVACLELPIGHKYFRSGEIGVMKIPEMFCAVFHLKGIYGDLKKYMDAIYHEWLPQSAYEKVALPSFALYEENHFMNENETFVLDFCVPIKFK